MSDEIKQSERSVNEILGSGSEGWSEYEKLVVEKAGLTFDEIISYCIAFPLQKDVPFELAISDLLMHRQHLAEGVKEAEVPAQPEAPASTEPAPEQPASEQPAAEEPAPQEEAPKAEEPAPEVPPEA